MQPTHPHPSPTAAPACPQVKRLGYRVRRALPAVPSVTAAYGFNLNLNLGFDFDTDVTTKQAGVPLDPVLDTAYQGRLLYFTETNLNAWTEVNAVYEGGVTSAAPTDPVWTRSKDNFPPVNPKPVCWINGGNPIVCSAQQIWTGGSASYPNGGFQKLGTLVGTFGPTIWLKWGAYAGRAGDCMSGAVGHTRPGRKPPGTVGPTPCHPPPARHQLWGHRRPVALEHRQRVHLVAGRQQHAADQDLGLQGGKMARRALAWAQRAAAWPWAQPNTPSPSPHPCLDPPFHSWQELKP
jgi:hypothetical protein